jgi:hypothetical protein
MQDVTSVCCVSVFRHKKKINGDRSNIRNLIIPVVVNYVKGKEKAEAIPVTGLGGL